MHASLTVLRKGSRSITIQGMVHVGDRSFYEGVQRRLEIAVSKGHHVFFEGVRSKAPSTSVPTKEAQDIGDFLKFLFALYPKFATAMGCVEQSRYIRYPEGAVNADIALHELTLLLDVHGFRAGWLMEFVRMMPKKDLKREIDTLATKENLEKKPGLFSRFMIWFFFIRKVMPVLLGYRNRVAVAAIRKYASKQHAHVHYGEAHVAGIVKMLRREGWEEQSKEFFQVHE